MTRFTKIQHRLVACPMISDVIAGRVEANPTFSGAVAFVRLGPLGRNNRCLASSSMQDKNPDHWISESRTLLIVLCRNQICLVSKLYVPYTVHSRTIGSLNSIELHSEPLYLVIGYRARDSVDFMGVISRLFDVRATK